jgi:hypothetical protein
MFVCIADVDMGVYLEEDCLGVYIPAVILPYKMRFTLYCPVNRKI